jgi:N-acetyl-anhydromuramyl-L-alanine amidase AmpD
MLGNWNSKLYEPRQGLLLHYDDSSDDKNAVLWLTKDPRCHVSYNRLYLDNGEMVQIAPDDKRAWHAGVCSPSNPQQLFYKDANSAFHGWAIAASDKDVVKPLQYGRLLNDAVVLFKKHGWTEVWRVTTHHLEAWPRGRKVDIEGTNPKRPVFDLAKFRTDLQERLKWKSA